MKMMISVLPVTQLPEALFHAVATEFGVTTEKLEEELRRRRVEWDLLPRDIQKSPQSRYSAIAKFGVP